MVDSQFQERVPVFKGTPLSEMTRAELERAVCELAGALERERMRSITRAHAAAVGRLELARRGRA